MTFFRLYQHLLPHARAWRITIDKRLRQFFQGLSGFSEDVKDAGDDVFLDVFPQTTRELDLWEEQFALPQVALTEQERRDRLEAAWKQQGGQDPRYIQDILQANGFPVYVHEFWVPGSEPAPGVKACATARNPNITIASPGQLTRYHVECEEPDALCGETEALCGNLFPRPGYALINNQESLPLPTDVDKWSYILYIGGETYGDTAAIPASRRNEFETLCLKICPTQQWLGVIVEYT